MDFQLLTSLCAGWDLFLLRNDGPFHVCFILATTTRINISQIHVGIKSTFVSEVWGRIMQNVCSFRIPTSSWRKLPTFHRYNRSKLQIVISNLKLFWSSKWVDNTVFCISVYLYLSYISLFGYLIYKPKNYWVTTSVNNTILCLAWSTPGYRRFFRRPLTSDLHDLLFRPFLFCQ